MNELLEKLEAVPDAQKYGAVVALIAIMGGLFWWMIYQPNTEIIDQKNNEISQLEAEIKKGEAMKAKERELEAEIARLDEQLKLALEFLPVQKEMNTFIKTIENLAVDSGLAVDRFLPRAVEKEGFRESLPVEIGFRGDYRGVGKFFEELAFQKRIVLVYSLRLTSLAQPGVTVNGTIIVKAFYFTSEGT